MGKTVYDHVAIYQVLDQKYASPMTRERMHPDDVRVDPTGVKLVEAIRKCALVKETGNDLKKVITYLQTNLGDDIKIPALSEEEVKQSMIALKKIKKRKSKKNRSKFNARLKKGAKIN